MSKATERHDPKGAFVGGSWSDSGEEDDEKVKDETCLVAHASSEVCSESSYFSDENSSIGGLALDNDMISLGFNSFEASSSGTKEIKFVKAQKKASPDGEPKNVNEALGDESCIVAMQEELNQFVANDVWELVPQPRNMTIIGTKWVFRNKLDENGIVSRNKARCVAKVWFLPPNGFTLILATLDGLDVGLLGDVIGEDDCDDDG
ncbi:hypothetical protein Tco_1553651 [Tanacetum coccineum]